MKITSSEQKQVIINRYLSGESVNSISTETGIPRSTLYYWIDKHKKASTRNPNITLREFSANKRKIQHLSDIIEILQSSPCSAMAPLQERLTVIEEFSAKYHVHTLCEALKVSKGTYYNHILRNKRKNSMFNQKCAELKPIIQDIYDKNSQIFGPTKITPILRELGYSVSEKSVTRIMREMGLYSIRGAAKTMYKHYQKQQRTNILNQNFTADAPNLIWVSDVTQFNLNQKRFYICVIIDIFSRKVVSYHIAKKNSTQLVKTTFKKAYILRKPSDGLLFHTDNGSNYISNTFMNYLNDLGVVQSFSRVHIPYDNSVCESFFSTMKREELYRYKYSSVAEFMKSVEKYINFFNSERPHSTLKYKTPDKYEADFWLKQGFLTEE
ncbi:MAG: IS3 family transposase [Oscillospiraceae bacterium]|nr:IS3 family transposase [Oscillospiraceae bacterium]